MEIDKCWQNNMGIHMSKKYNDVRINSIERNIKKNPLDYLDYINKNKNEEEILKVLKYSGFFVTDRNETLFSNDTKRIIKIGLKITFQIIVIRNLDDYLKRVIN